jgi:translocator protein
MLTESFPHSRNSEPPPTNSWRDSSRSLDYLVLVLFVVGCLSVGGLGGWLTAQSVDTWYRSLRHPPLTPPAGVFGPVWTTLYIFMGTAAWLVWRNRKIADVRTALSLFGVQLALNFAWSGFFFGLRNPGLALADIGVLWATIGATLFTFGRHSPAAAALLMPYWAWVSFAVYLNAGFWWLNR